MISEVQLKSLKITSKIMLGLVLVFLLYSIPFFIFGNTLTAFLISVFILLSTVIYFEVYMIQTGRF